eukprot:284608-Rhodomonas_salina.2
MDLNSAEVPVDPFLAHPISNGNWGTRYPVLQQLAVVCSALRIPLWLPMAMPLPVPGYPGTRVPGYCHCQECSCTPSYPWTLPGYPGTRSRVRSTARGSRSTTGTTTAVDIGGSTNTGVQQLAEQRFRRLFMLATIHDSHERGEPRFCWVGEVFRATMMRCEEEAEPCELLVS